MNKSSADHFALQNLCHLTEKVLKKLCEIAIEIARKKFAHSWLDDEIMSRNIVLVKCDADMHEHRVLSLQPLLAQAYKQRAY